MKLHPKLEHTEVVGVAGGGAGIQLQEKIKGSYLEYELIDSHLGYKDKLFYIGNYEPRLPKVIGHHLVWNNRWLDEPSHADSFQILELQEKIAVLKSKGLIGVAWPSVL